MVEELIRKSRFFGLQTLLAISSQYPAQAPDLYINRNLNIQCMDRCIIPYTVSIQHHFRTKEVDTHGNSPTKFGCLLSEDKQIGRDTPFTERNGIID